MGARQQSFWKKKKTWEKKDSKIQAHTIYKTSDGKRVPGVTTITGLRAIPALYKWHNRLGLEGIESTKYVDKLAHIGTIAHYLSERHVLNEKPEESFLNDFSKNDISMAEVCVIKFFDWAKDKNLEIVFVEKPFVSEKYKYGGTIDILTKLNGVLTLVDIKTSSAVYDNKFTQLAGYLILLEEAGIHVQDSMILRIGRTEEEGFEPRKKSLKAMEIHKRIFLSLLDVYYAEKELRSTWSLR